MPHGTKTSPSYRFRNYRHANEDEHRTAEQYFWRRSFWLSVATTLAAVTAAIFAVLGWQQARHQTNDAHESLVLSEAAFVYGNPFRINPYPRDGIEYDDFVIPIGNSGGTPTRGLRYRTNCQIAPDLKQDFFTAGLEAGNERTLILGPRSEIAPIACAFPMSDMKKLAATQALVAVFGSAEYGDRVVEGSSHKTEFCYLAKITDAPMNVGGTIFACPNHNCVDDECKEQDAASSPAAR